MTRLVHTADTHLGYRQYHEEQRRRDFLAAFRSVLEDAIEDDVDGVVHAGDLFHDRRPELDDVLGAVDALRELREAGIPFLAVVGNHEGTRSAQWVDLFERLGLAERLDTDGRTVGCVTLYGLDYTPAANRPSLDYEFAPPTGTQTALVSHGAFQPFEYGDWELSEVLTASPVEFDIVLLGDNHEPARETVQETPAVYAGSTERTAADEREPRGYNIVTFDDDGPTVRRRGLSTRPFRFIDIELGPAEGGDQVTQRLRETDVEDAVAIVTITGAGERVVPADIEAVGEAEGALVTRVNDRRDREGADESGLDVSFADPDAAVDKRVTAEGFSDAARQIDALVRTDDVANTALRDRVHSEVAALLDEDAAFKQAQGTAKDESGAAEPPDEGDSQVTMEDYL
ncbi:MAG: metallophosphoesterase [Halodesulfurarchaeum sp.]